MAEIIISEHLAERIREFARRENRTVEEMFTRMLDLYIGDDNDSVTLEHKDQNDATDKPEDPMSNVELL